MPKVFLCPPERITISRGKEREGDACMEPLSASRKHNTLKPQEARVGMRVKVADHHRIEQRRGLVGKVVGCYGGKEHVVVDVRFPDGRQRLFRPEDVEELASPPPWWRSFLLGGESES